MKKYTTKDIARLANVSRGTVDRVLHERGKVSESAEKKIKKVLSEINYQPNLIARTLRENKIIEIATLIPSPNNDPFWLKPKKGIDDALSAYSSFGLNVQQHFYNQNDSKDFANASEEILDSNPDGILAAPLFRKEAETFFDKCEKLNIPYATFNTRIGESNQCCFIGQNLYQSGRIAADLIFKQMRGDGKVLIFHFDEEISNSPHLQEKERGFKDYFKEVDINSYSLKTFNLINDYSHKVNEAIKQETSSGERCAIFVTTSKTFEVAKHLSDSNRKPLLVGYDLVDENVKHLKSNQIDYLINQNPRKQAFQGIHYLNDLLVFKKDIPKQELLPIDIITKENISTYI
ncbi:MAG: substrate-binding domain-containing protein [Cyclobacteriaceae bacterium]